MHHNIPLGIVSAQTAAYLIEQSLLFDDSSATYLSRTPSTAGNRKTWTFSVWVKRGVLTNGTGQRQFIFTAYNPAGSIGFDLEFSLTDEITFYIYNSTAVGQLTTSAKYRDPSAWYHIVIAVDTTQATASNRLKLYVNGMQITDLATATYPSQNFDTEANNTAYAHYIGIFEDEASFSWDGLMALPILVDGAALDATSFGKEDDDGYWNPIAFTGVGSGLERMISRSGGTAFGDLTGTSGLAAAQNGTTSEASATCARSTTDINHGYVGTDWGNGVTYTAQKAYVWPASDNGFHQSGANITLTLYGSNSSPANGTDGTSLGSTGPFTDATTPRSITATVTTTAYRYHWVYIEDDTGGAKKIACAELQFTVLADDQNFGTNGGAYDFADSSNFGLDVSGGATDTGVVLFQSNFDGSDAATTATDASPYARAITFNGSAELDTSAYKYGTASLQVPGVAATHYVSVPDSDDFDFSATDFTVEAWVRFDTLSVDHILFSQEADANNSFWLGYQHTVWGFFAQGKIAGAGGVFGHNSLSGYAINTWYHIALVKQGGTVYVYRDGVSLASSTVPVYGNIAADWRIGGNGVDPSFQGRIDDVRITKGVARYPNGTTFTVPASAHAAPSINTIISNSFYSSGFVATDQLSDTPTDDADLGIGNFATLNPNDKGGGTLSQGNRYFSSGSDKSIRATMSGTEKYQIEFFGYNELMFGLASAACALTGGNHYSDANSFMYYGYNGNKVNTTFTSYGSAFTTDSTYVGMTYDPSNGDLRFYLNGTDQGTAFTMNTSVEWYPYIFLGAGNQYGLMNFGQTPFEYPISGFTPLATQNFPAPTIADGSDYFNTVLYTGNGTAIASGGNPVTGVGFDLTVDGGMVWLKDRTSSNSHQLYDTVRGASKAIQPDLANAEATATEALNSFDSDGFTLGNNTGCNNNTNNYVAWCWKAGGAAVSNTDGSITSSVSANPTAGFSIMKYTGNATSGATVGHGLSSAPKFMIGKNLTEAATNWGAYHSVLTGTDFLQLDTAGATQSNVVVFNNTDPSASVVTLGSGSRLNGTSTDYILYAWAEVEGFSKFGSYRGNGSADGPFVFTGFRPAFVLIKRTDSATGWLIWDVARSTYNPMNNFLSPESSAAEGTSSAVDVDGLANGFKIRGTSAGTNASGGTYIFAAYAESPFQGGTADSSSQGRAR